MSSSAPQCPPATDSEAAASAGLPAVSLPPSSAAASATLVGSRRARSPAAATSDAADDAAGSDEDGFREVEAPPVSTCWKCKGSGKRLVKVERCSAQAQAAVAAGEELLPTHKGADTAAAKHVLVSVACIGCAGSGALPPKRKRAKVRPLKEFEGWTTPGPLPAGTADPGLLVTAPHLQLRPAEELSYLTGHWRIFQQTDAHRYSTDDVVTSWVAGRVVAALRATAAEEGVLLQAGPHPVTGAHAAPPAEAPSPAAACARPMRCLDQGCGIGSVLLMTAWQHPAAVCIGIEAQPPRAAQAARSIEYNTGAVAGRVSVVCGDLRANLSAEALPAATRAAVGPLGSPSEPPSPSAEPCFDLITGTPPYFFVGDGALPSSENSARCLFEYRGGVEDYCAAAARRLHPRHGLFVVCEGALATERGYAGAVAAGLVVLARVDVIPKAGKPPLFVVYVMCKAGAAYCSNGRVGRECFGLPGGEDAPAAESAASVGSAAAEAEQPPQQRRAGGPKRSRVHPGSQAGEPVINVLVRDAAAERTPSYKALLAEMGKPA